jgi:hypothetical protein
MIPQNLISKIESGNAKLKTLVAGWGGVNFLPVPSNTYIVITDIKFFPYTDSGLYKFNTALSSSILKEILRSSIQQLKIYSQKSSNHFIVRWDVSFSQWVLNNLAYVLNFGGNNGITFETYLVHDSDVNFELLKCPDLTALMTVNDNVLPNNYQNFNNPLGYGRGIDGLDTIRSIRLNNLSFENIPININNFPATPGAVAFNNMEFPANDLTRLNSDPFINGCNCNFQKFPIIDIQYVEILKNSTENTQSSS